MSTNSEHRFQVDLSGLIELLSCHLYSGPAVFVREMLQNGVDAISAQRKLDSEHIGKIEIELIESNEGPATLVFRDNGIGLTEDEIHQFLATIGQSSKRGGSLQRPGDFLGQFGIGLLSCFMVTDEIAVITKSAADPEHPAVEWRGNSNGTYSVRTLSSEFPSGTQVFLRAKQGAEEFFEIKRIRALASEYGEYLPQKITLSSNGDTYRINAPAPWKRSHADPLVRDRLIAYGEEVFGRQFLDVIHLKSSAGKVECLAFVVAEPVHAGVNQAHRVYLKNMLLSTKSHSILPDWAFFVQCIVNADSLKPTASRESFYEDDRLEDVRQELAEGLRRYLVDLARTDHRRFQHLLAVHHLAVKGLALDDDECLRMFAEWLPFETTHGRMTLGEFRQDNPVVRYVPTVDQFRQISQVAVSESLAIINAGYVYDVEILQRIGTMCPDIEVEQFEVADLSDRFEELTLSEREETVEFERFCDLVLQRFKCTSEVSKFKPTELPVLYVTNENADFLRSVEQAQDETDDLWRGVLGGLSEGVADAYSRLHLNFRNPLVRRIGALKDREAQRRCVEMLYIQALLLGHFPLKKNEVKLLNEGLLGLLDLVLAKSTDDNDE